jgi:NCS1 family nucleobase:cation symporter-1
MSFLPGLLIMVIVQVALAVYGHNMIHAVERWLAVLLTLVFVAVSLFVFSHVNYATPFNPKAPVAFGGVTGGVIEAVALAVSYILGWTTYASDYTRYLPSTTSPRSVFRMAGWSNLIACLWLEMLGVGLALLFPAAASGANPVQVLVGIRPHWLVDVALVAVALGTITANVLNIYSASLSALVVNVPAKRWVTAVLVGLVGAVVAWVGHTSYYANFENFLFLLAYWLAPWGAVVLVDYFLVHRGRYDLDRLYDPRRVVRPGLWAWAIGVVCSIPFFNQTLYVGPIAANAPQLGDLSYFVSFIIAGGLYWLMARPKAGAPA